VTHCLKWWKKRCFTPRGMAGEMAILDINKQFPSGPSTASSMNYLGLPIFEKHVGPHIPKKRKPGKRNPPCQLIKGTDCLVNRFPNGFPVTVVFPAGKGTGRPLPALDDHLHEKKNARSCFDFHCPRAREQCGKERRAVFFYLALRHMPTFQRFFVSGQPKNTQNKIGRTALYTLWAGP